MFPSFEYDVFLSYNRADKPRVRRLAERLRAAGLRVWFDQWVIQPGDDIYMAIEKGLEVSRVLVLCLSPAALRSDWVKQERSTVLFRDASNNDRRFVPLLLASCCIPDAIRRYRFIDFRKESDGAFQELITSCRLSGNEREDRLAVSAPLARFITDATPLLGRPFSTTPVGEALRSGIKRHLAGAASPLKSPEALLAAMARPSVKNVTLVGTSVTDFTDRLDNYSVKQFLMNRLSEGSLRLTVIILDPEGQDWLKYREKEISYDKCSPTGRNAEAYTMLVKTKQTWALQPKKHAPKTVEVDSNVLANFTIACSRLLPRTAFLVFSNQMYIRPYSAVCRGGDSPFLLELDTSHPRGGGAFDVYRKELQRIHEDAFGRLLPASDPVAGRSWLEHREIVHLLALRHPAVHLLCEDPTGKIWLQRRSESKGQNRLKWTSTVSGHVEAGDSDERAAVVREVQEELGRTDLPLGRVTLLTKGIVASTDRFVRNGKKVKHTCIADTSIYALNRVSGLNRTRTPEVDEVRAFSVRQIDQAVAKYGRGKLRGFLLADNFPRVWKLYREARAAKVKGPHVHSRSSDSRP